MATTERLTIICPAWLKEALKKDAKKKGVTMSEHIKDILKEAVKPG